MKSQQVKFVDHNLMFDIVWCDNMIFLYCDYSIYLYFTTQEKINESHHIGNAWVFPSISHSMGKCNKTHRMGRTWEIGNHTFPIVWMLFSHPIPILWYISSLREMHGFSYQFPQYGKMQQTHSMRKIWEIDNHTFPIVWVLFSHPAPKQYVLHHSRTNPSGFKKKPHQFLCIPIFDIF